VVLDSVDCEMLLWSAVSASASGVSRLGLGLLLCETDWKMMLLWILVHSFGLVSVVTRSWLQMKNIYYSFASDPVLCLLSGALKLERWCWGISLTRLTQVPTVGWKNNHAYPVKWMILSAVMLHPYFIIQLIGVRGSVLDLPIVDVGMQHIITDYAYTWHVKPPRKPPDSCNDTDWASGWDTSEHVRQWEHSVLHRAGYGDEYQAEFGNDLDNYLAISDMSLRVVNHCPVYRPNVIVELAIINAHYESFSGFDGHPSKSGHRQYEEIGGGQYFVPLRCSCGVVPDNLIMDSGASCSFTFDKNDFVGKITPRKDSANGFTGSAPIEGMGEVEWKVTDTKGKQRSIRTFAVYVPSASRRLFSPQRHFQHHGIDPKEGYFKIDRDGWKFTEGKGWEVVLLLNPSENLPVLNVKEKHQQTHDEGTHVSILDDINPNLNDKEKEKLLWHYRLGHIGFQWLEKLMRPGPNDEPPCIKTKLKGVAESKSPMCGACLFGRQKRRPSGNKNESKVKEMVLKTNDLQPGDCVSMDHYESTVRGRLASTKGREAWFSKYCGGTILVDHASGLVKVFHQVSLAAPDTLRSKRKFEQEARACGISVKRYHSDNGVFASKEFRAELDLLGQELDFSGVGAHHQNGVAERAIQTVVARARTMMIHAALLWPNEMSTDLWPMAMDYAAYLWNVTPSRESMIAPLEIFCGTKLDCTELQNARVFGCPAYVLEPTLQDGKKIPKWKPRSRRGQFLGLSADHASSIGIIRNLRTGHISPQFHVVYDDRFETVAREDDVLDPQLWNDLFHEQRVYYPEDGDVPPDLSDEWLDGKELQSRQQKRPTFRLPSLRVDDDADTPDDDAPAPGSTGGRSRHQEPSSILRKKIRPSVREQEEVLLYPQDEDAIDLSQDLADEDFDDDDDDPATSDQDEASEDEVAEDKTDNPAPRVRFDGLRRNPRREAHGKRWAGIDANMRDKFVPKTAKIQNDRTTWRRVHEDDYFAVFQMDWHEFVPTTQVARLLQLMTAITADQDTGMENYWHPLAYSTFASEADNPNYDEAMRQDHDGFKDAMGLEIKQLEGKDAWDIVPRSQADKEKKKILGSTWAFKRKRYPDGRVNKLKARICVRGDQQVVNVDVFDTFSPVVAWSTVRIMLVLMVALDLKSQQIDFANAFIQAELDEPVYVEMPRGFRQNGFILKLKRSVYGLRESPLNWFKKLSKGLAQQGYHASSLDACLFINKKTKSICVCWVDDCLFFSMDMNTVNGVIDALKKAGYDVEKEDDFAGFLGVDIKRNPDGTVELLQTGLTDRIIAAMGLADANGKGTPATPGALGSDVDGADRKDDFSYPSIIGMMLYLQANTRPDITFAVSQAARFSRQPKLSHETAIKRIGKYLKDTKDKGMVIDLREMKKEGASSWLKLDLYADADFAGLWTYEDPNLPISVKSRSGWISTLGGIPVTWASKLQELIAFSTMESEYICLSTAMKEFVPLRRVLAAILAGLGIKRDAKATISTAFEDNEACLKLANLTLPRMTPRSKPIAIRYHWFRSHVAQGEIEIKSIRTHDQKADIMTKGLPMPAFVKMRTMIMGW
jgi:hypothetical protein